MRTQKRDSVQLALDHVIWPGEAGLPALPERQWRERPPDRMLQLTPLPRQTVMPIANVLELSERHIQGAQRALGHRFLERGLRQAAGTSARDLVAAVEDRDQGSAQKCLWDIGELVDRDRGLQALKLSRQKGLPYVEYAGWVPVPDEKPVRTHFEGGSQWKLVSLERERDLVVPEAALPILRSEERSGLVVDRLVVAHELGRGQDYEAMQKPLTVKLLEGAGRAAGSVVGAVGSGALALLNGAGSVFDEMAAPTHRDPALVGVLLTPLPGREWGAAFILVRWV